ncbi:polysaccharide deacetylase [Paenibacillus sp. N4]|uniref:polysaccharide deacetylase family protein n=1 Tax=Paenibacillus vietnamensis TaxID=2590547 RepID=UPI001CD0DEFC|nr:polysaccharide deacetylase family protein [Paenibacillus vietnamensis]MCA0758645.1 polysaccharide deacetylase [Paenibacillus vietnamensis]
MTERMRRVMRAAICALAVWFGLFEPGGGYAGYLGEAAGETAQVRQNQLAVTALSAYDAKLLLAEPALAASEGSGGAARTQYASAAASAGPDEDKPQKRTEQASGNGKTVYLTFDDGPSRNTGEVLDLLKREGIAATFFVLGEHVKQQPALTKRIVREGHSIGNHTYNHKYAEIYGSFGEFADQVMKTDELIFKTTGVRTRLLRAPGGTYGNFDQGYFDALAEAGYLVHDWNVDSGDSKRTGVPVSEIIATVKGSKLADKLVVLLHDSTGHEASVKALPAIINYYKAKGYTFAPLTERVEPIRFRMAVKPKWTRAKVTRAEKTELVRFANSLTKQAGQTAAEAEAPKGTPKPSKPVGQKQPPEPKLVLHLGDGKLELESGTYSLGKGVTEVRLTKLMELAGGTVTADAREGRIEAKLNDRHAVWLLDAEDASAREEVDRFAVPVRSTMEQLGFSIEKYVLGDKQREIWIAAQ